MHFELFHLEMASGECTHSTSKTNLQPAKSTLSI